MIRVTDEQRKEICKDFYYEITEEKIAEIENVSQQDVEKVILWGEQTGYMKALEGGAE